MAEVLIEFVNELSGSDGNTYEARACAREIDNGLWEGWVEFVPTKGGDAVRTRRETTQPNHDDIHYWATGLTAAYLEGALARALAPQGAAPRREEVSSRPAFDAPAPAAGSRGSGGGTTTATRSASPRSRKLRSSGAILDPFRVYQEGDGVLEKQLGALDVTQLRHIIQTYELTDETMDAMRQLSKPQLVTVIIAAVERRTGH